MSSESITGTLIGAGLVLVGGLVVHAIQDRGPQIAQPLEIQSEKPQLCEADDSVKGQPVIVKVGVAPKAGGYDVVFEPGQDCQVNEGTVVTWIPDTGTTSFRIDWVVDPLKACDTSNYGGKSLQVAGPSSHPAIISGGVVPPISLVANRSSMKYGYCVTLNENKPDYAITPNPAIIVKE
jgi:hypothetical protein